LTDQIKFYHRQHQPQWGEHPIRLKQHPSKSWVFNGKAKPANCRCGGSGGHSCCPRPPLLGGTAELRNIRSRCRVWAGVRNVVPGRCEITSVQLPERVKTAAGGIDLGKNISAHDVYLIGPTVELIARKKLHPALSDLLLETAREVHGNATLLQRKGEFPAPIEHDIKISDDAARFYKSGTGFFYQFLPFWLASLTSRIVVVFIPMLVILIPLMRSVPHLYRWRNQQRIYRWYRALLVLEKELFLEPDLAKRQLLLKRLDEIQNEVNKLKVSAFLADQFYGLRGHIDFVRQMMSAPPRHIEVGKCSPESLR
jgi:hypothetical protein